MKKHLEITEENINSKSNLVVSPTTYTINNEDLVIRFTVNGTVSNGQMLINGNYIYAKSFTQNSITFNNSDFKIGSNNIDRLALIVNDAWAMWDNGITVIKNNEVIPPVDDPPTISTIANINAKVNETISIIYNATDDNAITKHELSQNGGSSYSQINPTNNSNTYTHRLSYSSAGNRQCKIKVSDVKGQSVVSNNFTISVTEDTVEPPPVENRPPTISGISISNVSSNGSYKLDYIINDADNDKMTVELKIGSQAYKVIASSQSNGAKTYNGYGLSQGIHTCYLKVGDGKLFTTSNSFSINVSGGSSNSLQAKWEAYTSTLQALREAMHNATVKIAQVKADDIKTQLDKDIADLNDALEGLDDILNGAFEDGILSDAEKLVIKKQLQTISKEKGDVDKQYETIYNNKDLIGVAKTNFKSAYDTYNTKYLNLVSVINEIVNKVGLVDATDQTRLNNAFDEYSTASSNYSKRANEAIDAIADKKADDAESNANKHTEAQIKVVKDEISLKVSQTEYDSNKNVVSEKLSKLEIDTEGIKTEVSKKVGVEEVKSTIQQSPESVKIGFNGINDRININSRSMDFTATNGNRDMLLYGGQVCAYNNMDNSFLSTVGAVLNSNNTFKGVGVLAGKYCGNFVIGRDSNWEDILTNRSPSPTYYMNIDFVNNTITMPVNLITGNINMKANNLHDVNVAYIKDLYSFGWKDFNSGKNILIHENNRIVVSSDMSFNGKQLINPKLLTDNFYYTNGHHAFGKNSSNNNMNNGVNWDWQGFDIVNARMRSSNYGYEVINNIGTKSIDNNASTFDEIEVISSPVKNSFKQLDISNVTNKDEVMLNENNADLGKLVTLLFEEVKNLKNEIEILKAR